MGDEVPPNFPSSTNGGGSSQEHTPSEVPAETYNSAAAAEDAASVEESSRSNSRKKRRYSLLNKVDAEQSDVGNASQEGASEVHKLTFVVQNFHEEENESACCECEGGGELICCDTCIRAFHMSDSAVLQWSCPVCMYFRVHDVLEQRRGVLLSLQHPIAVPSLDCDPRVKRLRSRKAQERDEECDTSHRVKRFTHQDLFHESHHHYLFEDIKKQRVAAEATTESPIIIPGASSSVSSSVRTTRRATAAAAVQAAEKRSDLSAISSVGRMNVGPAFQVPQLPIPFVEAQDIGRPYYLKYITGRAHGGKPRLMYSATDWKSRARELGRSTPLDDEQHLLAIKTGKRQQHSPSEEEVALEELEQEAQLETELEKDLAAADQDFVDTDEKVTEFCQNLASQWPTRCHWPYSSEYAYKILQYAGFNAKTALDCVRDPTFDFNTVCDPPVRPYFNKWRPKDKRSFFPSTPFPPPQHFRVAYGSVGARTRLQAAYGYR